jgi:hypothetical protein
MHARFLKNLLHVIRNRRVTNPEPLSDLLLIQSMHGQFDNLLLARGETFDHSSKLQSWPRFTIRFHRIQNVFQTAVAGRHNQGGQISRK